MNHRGTKVLETERLRLRPFRAEDAEPMFRNWASDPEVTKFLTWPPHENVKATGQVLDEWIKHYEDPKNYNWAIQWKKTNEPIGSMTAVRIDNQTESATVGYCIGQNWWRQGVTSEALQAVMDFFFREVGANCVNACHDPRNPNSGRVMKKCGMTLEGTRRAGGVNNQGICDETWYSILKEEYEKKKRPDGGNCTLCGKASSAQTGTAPMELNFKKAALEDLEMLTKTRGRVLRAANQLEDSQDMSEVEAQSRAYYRKALVDGSHTAYLVLNGETLIGTGGISYYTVMPTFHNPSGKKAYVMNMYTEPGSRRKGIAAKILDLLVRDAKERGIHSISLEATAAGRPLYEAYGFVRMEGEMELPQ